MTGTSAPDLDEHVSESDGHRGSRPGGRGAVTTLRQLAKFTSAVALLAILADAAVGHALLWENDPYWTYWVTKTFLIATVFGLGTAWVGTGVGRGAALTAVHTLVLTVYYWTLSPIGLPSSPEWLDLQHTWVTGVPIHFGVIYLGYLAALWLWQRRGTAESTSIGRDAALAVAIALGIVLASGAVETAILEQLPGFTWFLVRLLICVPFIILWWAFAGRDRAAAVGGGITLALVLACYSHFVGPVGLPDTDLRLLAQDPPPAGVHWTSYQDEFLIAWPLTTLAAVLALLAATPARLRFSRPGATVGQLVTAGVGLVALLGVGLVTAEHAGPGDEVATVRSAGQGSLEQGAYYLGNFQDTQATLELTAESRNPRVTPLRPHDRVDLTATVTGLDGVRYDVRATQPMVADPYGRHTTWNGVGVDRWHHGRSGIGSTLLPATRSELAVYALADLTADGTTIATGVPTHVMTLPTGGVELHVGDPQAALPGVPDGHLRVSWDSRDGVSPEAPERARHAYGTLALLLLILLGLTAIRIDRSSGPAHRVGAT
jgi:hypothetical protein